MAVASTMSPVHSCEPRIREIPDFCLGFATILGVIGDLATGRGVGDGTRVAACCSAAARAVATSVGVAVVTGADATIAGFAKFATLATVGTAGGCGFAIGDGTCG